MEEKKRNTEFASQNNQGKIAPFAAAHAAAHRTLLRKDAPILLASSERQYRRVRDTRRPEGRAPRLGSTSKYEAAGAI